MKHQESFVEKLAEKIVEESSKTTTKKKAYTSYRISNFEELVAGLKEIGAPVKLDKTDKSLIVDGKRFKFPEGDIAKKIKFDDKVVEQLRQNAKLSKMWKEVKAKYSNFVKNIRTIKIPDPEMLINWGPTSPDQMNKFYKSLKDAIKVVEPLIATPEGQEILRKYEVLRHLYDRGYSNI